MVYARWMILVLAALFFPLSALAYPRTIPGQHVYDEANYFADAGRRQALETELVNFEHARGGTRLLILTVATTSGVEMDRYAVGALEAWNLDPDRGGRGNAAVIVIARRSNGNRGCMSIAVTGDLLSVLPHNLRLGIVREIARPASQTHHDPQAGIEAASHEIVRLLNAALPPVTSMSQPTYEVSPVYREERAERDHTSLYILIAAAIVLILFILLIVYATRRRSRISIGGDVAEAVVEGCFDNAGLVEDAASAAIDVGSSVADAASDAFSGGCDSAGDFFD